MSETFVVTGMGLVSAAGDSVESLMAAMIAGEPLPGAAIEGFDATRYIPRKGAKDLSRLSQLTCSAASANARGLGTVSAESVGVVFGTAWGSLKTVIDFEREAHVQGARFVDPILFTETVSNVPAGQAAILYGWSAFNATLSSGTISGLAALRQGVSFLEEGRGAVAVAGGGDEFNPGLISALKMRGWAGRACGEGACFLTIESEEHARFRGATPLGSITATVERFGESQTGLMKELLARAGLDATDIGVIVCGDESRAAAEVFEAGKDSPAVVIPKKILGETWGASGSLAAALALEIMRTSTIPAAAGTIHRDVAHAMIVDRSEAGQQLGLVLSAA